MFADIAAGFHLFLNPWVIVLVLAGVMIGDVFAAIPGLTAGQAIALVLPFTVYMQPVIGLAFLIGLYKGGCYGGSTSAILLGTPGSPEATATILDGWPLAQKGYAGKAMKMAVWASATGDLLATIALIFGTAALAPIALKIGPPEYFAVLIFSLTIIAMVGQGSLTKALIAAGIGILLASIGLDPISGANRFTFGYMALSSGIRLIPLIIGLFSVSELLVQAERFVSHKGDVRLHRDIGHEGTSFTWPEYRRSVPTMLRGSVIGIIIGALPGLNAAIAAFTSYGLNRRFSRYRAHYGQGETDGVAAVESANSATVGTTLVPLLTLGIPGSGTAAMFLAAFQLQGINVGPLVFQQAAPVIYGMYMVFALGVVANLLGGLAIRSVAHRILAVPGRLLFPMVVFMCLTGALLTNNSIMDVATTVIFGVLGYLLRKVGIPLAPLLIAFVLGNLTETTLRQSLLLFDGRLTGFLHRPISVGFFILTVVVVVFLIMPTLRNQKQTQDITALD